MAEDSEMVSYIKALANETRLRLLGLLAGRERSVGELAEIGGLKEPTVSHHLARLHGVGLVARDRLSRIPVPRKKRDVILQWLAERCETGKWYPEGEVKEVIRRHHPDNATLHRD